VATPRGFTQAGANATTQATLIFLGAVSRFNIVQFHLSLALHQIGDSGNHSAVFRCIKHLDRVMHPTQAQATHTGACGALVPIMLLTSVTLIFFCSLMTYPVMSSTDLPRLAAISDGVDIFNRPSIVARTTL